jgi:two-component system, NtrC family, response regulator AtoC
MRHFEREMHHLVITDLKMPGELSGLDLVRRIKEQRPETLVLLITAHGTIETAVEAMRFGAHDYIVKPVDLGMLRLQVRRAFEHHELVTENQRLRQTLAAVGQFPDIVGQSAAIQDVFRQIRQVADTDATILVEGESGSGKELVARALHGLSARQQGPFIAVNVAALPETLMESELFGYEKGAFTGAIRTKPGWFESAHGGTLFLDEVAEMTPKSQVDLLRVLEQREVRRLGSDSPTPIDTRLIAATHRDVAEMVGTGAFREDLYYRINVIPIRVPPLRERRDDIPLLVQHFLARAAERHGRPPRRMAEAAMRLMCDYHWPGNVRQLRNVMERLVLTSPGTVVHVGDLPEELRLVAKLEPVTLEAAVQEAEKHAIHAALVKCDQHRERTANLLGVSVRTLHYKMNRYSLQ